jgi:hypothetical protein
VADVSYSVEVNFLSRGSINAPAMKEIANIEKRVSGLQKQLEGAGKGLGTGLAKGAAMFLAADVLSAGVGAAMGVMKVGLIEMNAEIEQMSITMATMFSAHGNTDNFEQGLESSKELIKIMRRDAQALPGEFKDLSNIMLRMVTPALNSGLSIRETEKLAANAMALGVGSGLKADVVGREMGSLIQGQMRKQMPILKVLPNFNMEAKEFNALPIEKRVEKLKKSLGMLGGPEAVAMEAMRNAFEHSWTGLTTTIKDNVKQILGVMSYNLFERIKSVLSYVNTWYSTNKDTILGWAEKVGYYMANGFSAAFHQLARLEPLLMRIGGFLGKEAASGRLTSDIGKVLGIAGGLKMASYAARPAAKLASALMTGGGAGSLVSSAGSALGGIGAAAGVGGGVVGTLAGLGIVLGVLAAVGTTVYGVFEGLANAMSPLNEYMTTLWHSIKVYAYDAFETFGRAWDIISPVFNRLSEVFGASFLALLDGIAQAVDVFAHAVEGLLIIMRNNWGMITELAQKAFHGTIPPELFEPDRNHGRERPEREHFYRGADLDRKVAPPPNHTTNIHRVEIKVNSNQDPNRIAKRTADILMDIHRHPKVATLTGGPTLSR